MTEKRFSFSPSLSPHTYTYTLYNSSGRGRGWREGAKDYTYSVIYIFDDNEDSGGFLVSYKYIDIYYIILRRGEYTVAPGARARGRV